MAKPNNNTKQPINDRLSIQIGLSGLSFSVLDVSANSIIKLKHYNKERNLTPLEMLDFLKYVIDIEGLISKPYSQVTIIYRNELATLVPYDYFNEETLADYLKFNNKILATDFIAFDKIAEEIVTVYVPLVNVNNYLFDTFGSFTYKHFSTLFIEYIKSNYSNTHKNGVYVHVDGTMFEMLVINESKIHHYNTFIFNTKEDFIYYILFSIEQLEQDPNSIQLTFFGTITEESDLFKIAYKYVRNVALNKQSVALKHSDEIEDSKSNLALLNSFL